MSAESEDTYMRRNKIYRKTAVKFTGALLALTLLGTIPAFAGQWQQEEDGGWKYEENGEAVTGWIQSEGIWYYLDPDTGLWDPRPALNETSACRLLENAVNRAGWYSADEKMLVYKMDSKTKSTITVSILEQISPSDVGGTVNTFDINIKDGTAKSKTTKLVLDLYE